jgi:hypothetical protein
MAAATVLQAGVTVTQVTKIEGQRSGEDAIVRFMAEDEMARVEFVQGPGMGGKDGYFVTRDGGNTFYIVNPKEKTYMKFDMAQMAQAGAGVMQAMKGVAQMKISDPKVDKVLDEAGPSILGYPTRHYRLVTTYAMEMSFFGRKNVTKVVNEEDIWATTKFKFGGLKAWASKQQVRTGNEELDKLVDARKDMIQGLYLKHAVVNKSTDANKRETVTRHTTEVSEIKEGRLAQALFEMPAGYKEENINAKIDEAMSEAQAESAEADKAGADKETTEKQSRKSDGSGQAKPSMMDSLLRLVPKR